jgi:hypothetical protein
MVLVILDGLMKNCVPIFGRFGVTGPKTATECGVRVQGVPKHTKLILPKAVPFYSG